MALIVKLLFVLGLVGVGALAYVTYMNADTATKNQIALDEKRVELTAANEHIKVDEAKIKKQDDDLQDKAAQIATLNQQKSDLNTQLTDAQTKVSDIQKQLDAKTDEATQAEGKLNVLTQELGPDTVDSLRANATALQQEVAQKTTEMKILEDELQKAKISAAHIAKVLAEVNDHSTAMPPLSGKVKFVNQIWNFVVLDVGTAQGVVPKGELNVFRGRLYLGKLKISSVDTDSSVADIEPDVKGGVQVGDDVLSQ
jgi:hypothetical protein